MSDELHRITWDGDHATFHCDGDRTSPCHIYPDCDCEIWYRELQPDGTERHPHPDVPHDECWKLPWLTASDPEDSWDGDDEPMPRRDSVIETEWEGDFLLWSYPEPLAVQS